MSTTRTYLLDVRGTEEPLCLLVKMTPELVALILQRAALFTLGCASDPELRIMKFSGRVAAFLHADHFNLGDELESALGDHSFDDPPLITVPEGTALPEREDRDGIYRTDGDRMVLCERGVFWSAHPKHGNETLETEVIPLADVLALQAGSLEPDLLACPEELGTPPGRVAHAAIVGLLREDGATFTGGARTFYTPAGWAALGHPQHPAAVLIVHYEGCDVAPYFSHDADADTSYVHLNKMVKVLEAAGFWSEEITTAYSAVYASKK